MSLATSAITQRARSLSAGSLRLMVRLSNLPAALQARLQIGPTETVTFTRLDSGTYRDGVRFANGQAVTLQELGCGVRAMVEDALVVAQPEFTPYAWRKAPIRPGLPELVE